MSQVKLENVEIVKPHHEDGESHRPASVADLVSALQDQGGEVVGVQIDSWGVPVLGYGDTITQEAYDSGATYLVFRIEDEK